MARLSMIYPRGPIDLGGRVRELPDERTAIPGLPGWRWIHTPGHTAGHVSLFREADRALIAGDAFVTTKQESAIAAFTQRPEVHGPPAYYTSDWVSARGSVQALAALEPVLAATGHGVPMRGDAMRRALHELARDFDRLAVPAHGRYVGRRAITDERGVVAVPPPVADPFPKLVLGAAAVALTGAAVAAWKRRDGRDARPDV
jgi:glyoxylase-like metal-dependent hydrolase (beta-lactamase superfamily II)